MITKESPPVKSSRGKTIRKLRGILKRTQQELANALGISSKAIQSYEQGWRPVPIRVMIQMLVLLGLQQKQGKKAVTCWEIKKCVESKRNKCASYIMGHGQFCWFVAGRSCNPKSTRSKTKILPCLKCPVVMRLLKS